MGESRCPGKGTWTPLIWEQGLDVSQKLVRVHSCVCAHTHLLRKRKARLLTFKCWQLIQMQTCNNWKYLRVKKMFMDYLWPTDCQSATQDKKGRLWQMKQMWRDRESSLQSLWAGGRCSWPALPMLSAQLQAGLCAQQHSLQSRCGLWTSNSRLPGLFGKRRAYSLPKKGCTDGNNEEGEQEQLRAV